MSQRIAYLAICLTVIMVLTGCQTTRTGSLCSLGFFDPDENWQQRLTRGEKEYLGTLNESGEEICGWQPVRR